MSTVTRKIPFADLKVQYASIRNEIDAAIRRVIENTSFVLGPEARAFEQEFAEFCGFRHVIGVGNGTDAIELAIRAAGLSAGDEIVSPTHTFIATTEAITSAGCKVRLCDVSEETFCVTAETLEAACTENTRAIVPVPIYGNPACLAEAAEFARKRGIKLIADCAQAHAAKLDGKRLGELVDIATFSFYPGKNLGAYGDAGAVATNDDEIAARVRMWRNHGREGKFDHEFEAVNSRMDGMQAAVLRAKLPHLQSWTDGRRRVAGWYREHLASIRGLELPAETEGAEHVYHLFVVRVDDRDGVRKTLGELGISTGVHYPDPIHALSAYRHLGHEAGSFPAAEAICRRILSLPMYPEMDEADVVVVAEALRKVLADR